MKYMNFITRALCLVILLVTLSQYQVRAARKAQEEAENAATIAEVEAYNREVEKKIAEAEGKSASPYADGTYEGSADGFGGPIRVEVTIEGGDLTAVNVLEASSEDPAYFSQAEAVLGEILSTQGVAVETVSGATFSSRGLIDAATDALRKAAAQ
ncbi:MAG: FMN-binding protein [Lachnospiraceae bacterium]|nr:FMN-binding protein [Lachnospiraceae bacterium]